MKIALTGPDGMLGHVIQKAFSDDVDLCESEPEKAYFANGLWARNVVTACEEANCPIL